MTRAREFLLGKKFLLGSDHKPLEFIFHPRKELPKLAMKLMAFNYEIEYVKGNTIPHVDALSRLQFEEEQHEKNEKVEDGILHLVETNVLLINRLMMETLPDPVLNRIVERIKNNKWSDCSKAESPYKEIQQIDNRNSLQWRSGDTTRKL